MSDLGKWGEREVSSLAHQLKDDIVNKGKLERDRKRAKRAAERRATRSTKWKKSTFRRWLLRLLILAALVSFWFLVWSELV
jgi:hypothetical protein